MTNSDEQDQTAPMIKKNMSLILVHSICYRDVTNGSTYRLNDSIGEMYLTFTSAGVICYMYMLTPTRLISPWTLIRLFLGEQSDLGPNCLL